MQLHVAEKLRKPGVNDVKLSIAFRQFGVALYSVFEPVIFYQILDEKLEYVLVYYGLQSLFYALIVHLGTKVMTKIGIKKNMIIATLFMILYSFLVLMFAEQNLIFSANQIGVVLWFIILGIVCAIYQSLYWPAFHTDLSLFIRRKESGTNLSVFYFIGQIASIAGPILGGLLLLKVSVKALILLRILLILISILPLFYGPDHKVDFQLKFRELCREIVNKKRIRFYLPFYAEGISGYINAVFWTLFVYTVLESVLDLGFLAAGVSLVNGFFVLILGRIMDRKKGVRTKALNIGVATTSLGWIIKGIPGGGLFFFFADNIQKFGASIMRVPYEKAMYSTFKSIRSFADEYVTIREMTYHIGGGLIMLILALVIAQSNLMYSAFIVAALSSVVFLFMR